MKRQKNIEVKNEQQLETIKGQGEKQLHATEKQNKNKLKAIEKHEKIVYVKNGINKLLGIYPKSFNKKSINSLENNFQEMKVLITKIFLTKLYFMIRLMLNLLKFIIIIKIFIEKTKPYKGKNDSWQSKSFSMVKMIYNNSKENPLRIIKAFFQKFLKKHFK